MKARWVIGVLGFVGLSLGLAGTLPAQSSSTTIYACVSNKSGSVTIVSASTICSNNFTKISWNTVGPPGPKAAFSFFDANGNEVGPAIGIELAIFNVGGLLIPLRVAQGILFGTGGTLVFESADCSGTAFADIGQQPAAPFTPLLPVSLVTNGKLYIANAAGPFQTITALSSLNFAGTCFQFTNSQQENVTQATFVADLNTLFTPPFSMR